MDKKIALKVNGNDVEMNEFVKKVFINVVNGLADSLSRLPEDKDIIEIRIEELD